MHIVECKNRAIDLDQILPHTLAITKGIANWRVNKEDKKQYHAVWFSCNDIALRQHGKPILRVRDLIDCAFETEQERDEFFDLVMLKWKHMEEVIGDENIS